VARQAEDCGFHGLFRSDHFLWIRRETLRNDPLDPNGVLERGEPGPTDSWVTLGALAVQTSRIRLGTLAIAVAQVDQMSGGRVELGLGSGWYAEEHAAYGMPFPDLGERFDRFEEQLAIITGLWETAPGETFSFDGKHYELTDSPALPKPVQQPRPPIVIGGSGPRRTPRLAARYANEFNANGVNVATSAAQFERVGRACREIGRDEASMSFSVTQSLCCGTDDAQVRRRADVLCRDVSELKEKGVAGSPAEVVEKLGRFAEAGANRAYLQMLDLDDLDQIALVGREVIRQLSTV
jgi:alkanesulfonate monooxygenase SsuD/methylene tetrahydromethanopterin reductase-like flavin-dependent oxidoreductase (luciferase family)